MLFPFDEILGDGFGRDRGESFNCRSCPSGCTALAFEEEQTMGMDVYGRNPSDECGRYFRASALSWPTLMLLTLKLCCPDLVNKDQFSAMMRGSGAGPDNQDACSAIADRFEQWLAAQNGHVFTAEYVSTASVNAATPPHPPKSDAEMYRVDRQLLEQWIEFLRHCGGFEVW